MKIFVSYRHDDTRHIAGRLVDRLRDAPGVKRVFIDMEEVDPGANFETNIDESLNESDVCLLLIGDDWMGASGDGATTRILDEADYVRHEVADALARGNKVIPVLVDGAKMPSSKVLPPDICSIVAFKAVHLRHTSFQQDMETVEDAIFSRKPGTPFSRYFRRRPLLTLLLKILAGVFIAGALLIAMVQIYNSSTDGKAFLELFDNSSTMVFVILLWLISGGAIAAWLSLRR